MVDSRKDYQPPSPLLRDGAFDIAWRHSRRVRLLRVLVPLVAALAGLAFVIVVWFNPFRPKDATLDIGSLSVSGDKVTMELPRLTGFNRNKDAYNVTAKTASQRITAPGLIELTDLEALIAMPDSDKATLRASNGQFDSNREFLTLKGRVSVQSTKGYSAELASAAIDFKQNTVVSDEPVKVRLNGGVIAAGAMTVTGGGETINFTGGVTSSFAAGTKADTSMLKTDAGAPPSSADIRGTAQ